MLILISLLLLLGGGYLPNAIIFEGAQGMKGLIFIGVADMES